MIAIEILAAAVLALPQSTEQGGELVAEFVIGGQQRTLSRDDVAQYLARRHRNSSSGTEAVDYLIEVRLVEQAARAAGVMPPGEEVRAEIDRIRTSLRQQRMDLDELLAERRLSAAEFHAKTALGIAQRRLVGSVLKIAPAKVTAQHLTLWTREQRIKVPVETDQGKLPPGVLARVGKDEVTSLDVGRVLFTKITASRLHESINRMIFEQCIAHEARRYGVTLAPDELEAQFAKRKAEFEASGTNEGVDYERWLEAFGSNKEKELRSTALHTTLLHEKLVRRRYPDAILDERLAANRELLLKRHGARRSIHVIFIRATEKPNKILRRDFAAALAHAEDLRKQITDKKRPFALMAKIASDDATTKAAGGAVGWQHQEYLPDARGRRAPDEVLAAAFAMKVGDVSAPIRTAQGYFLVWVNGVEQEPGAETLRQRLLGEMAERYNRELYTAAKVEIKVK